MDYPSNFPLPDYGSYNGNINSGNIRTQLPFPEPNQKRVFNSATTQIAMTFTMSKSLFNTWFTLVKDNGYQWFVMPTISSYVPDYITGNSRFRFISDSSLDYLGHDWVRVSITGELIPGDTSENGANKIWLHRIIAGTPANPATDRILAGTPASPSTDRIIADLYGYEFERV